MVTHAQHADTEEGLVDDVGPVGVLMDELDEGGVDDGTNQRGQGLIELEDSSEFGQEVLHCHDIRRLGFKEGDKEGPQALVDVAGGVLLAEHLAREHMGHAEYVGGPQGVLRQCLVQEVEDAAINDAGLPDHQG